MTAPRWHPRPEPLDLRLSHEEPWGDDDEPELCDAAQYHRDWKRLVALNNRTALPFSLALLAVGDALHGGRALSVMAMRALSHALLSWTRIEDSVFRLDATTFGILLAGDTVDAARSFVERASGLLANTEVHEDGHPVFLEVLGGVAAWSGDMNSLSDLIDAARADLRSPGDGWTPGQYTRWDEPE